MNNLQRAYLLLLLIGLLSFYGRDADAQTYQRIAFEANPNQLLELQKAGIPLDHFSKIGNEVLIDLSVAEVALLKSIVPTMRIEIGDLTNYYATRNATPISNPIGASTPKNFKLGTMGGFLTYVEMQAALDSMHVHYPNLISARTSIGQTVEGREIWVVKISDAVAQNDTTEAEILYDAMHHAREPQAMMQLIYYMWHLLESYEQGDARAQFIINNRQLYFVPIVNPDGYVYNQTNSPNGGGMWRKNKKLNSEGSLGVDLNRNYAQDWGYDDFGSSPSPTSNTFRGLAPFSEPETQAMRNFVNSHKFRSNLSYHSYGEYLIYPFGAKENYYTADSFLFESYADSLTSINQYFSGTVFETLNYFANGGSCDWMYAAQSEHSKIMSFTPEVGGQSDGFWPLSSRIIPIAEENLEANYFLAERCLQTIRRDVPKRFITNTVLGTIPVRFFSDGYAEDLRLLATLDFPAGNTKFVGANDTTVIRQLPTFQYYVSTFVFAATITTADSIAAVLTTTIDGEIYRDTIQIVYDPNYIGIEKLARVQANLYPNPSQGSIRIETINTSEAQISITNMEGVLIQKFLTGPQQWYEIDGISPGMYLVKISKDGMNSCTKKLLVLPQ